jgi:hypothetical protein
MSSVAELARVPTGVGQVSIPCSSHNPSEARHLIKQAATTAQLVIHVLAFVEAVLHAVTGAGIMAAVVAVFRAIHAVFDAIHTPGGAGGEEVVVMRRSSRCVLMLGWLVLFGFFNDAETQCDAGSAAASGLPMPSSVIAWPSPPTMAAPLPSSEAMFGFPCARPTPPT